MAFDATTGPQLVNAASRGDLRALGNFLRDINDRLDTLTETELGYLDGLTIGTVTASKALVVDANKDLDQLRNLNVVNLDAGGSGTAGTVDIWPTTASKGKLIISVADQTGDTNVTLRPEAMGQATTVYIPDPGAASSYVVQSTAALTLAEADYLDGAVVGNSVASKTALLDSNKQLQTNANNGTANTNCTAVHYGDGINVTAVITITNAVITVGTSEDLATGTLIYTLPAGACLINSAYMSVAIAGVSTTNDTPDVGLGTVIGVGAVTTLDGTGTFENIITGQTAADTNGTATVKAAGPTAAAPLEITTAGAHTVHVNAADGWGANADQAGTLNGTVVINYTRLAA